jgi:hypothetical protein
VIQPSRGERRVTPEEHVEPVSNVAQSQPRPTRIESNAVRATRIYDIDNESIANSARAELDSHLTCAAAQAMRYSVFDKWEENERRNSRTRAAAVDTRAPFDELGAPRLLDLQILFGIPELVCELVLVLFARLECLAQKSAQLYHQRLCGGLGVAQSDKRVQRVEQEVRIELCA